MIGILVLSHGQFGEDLQKTACGIMNDPEHIRALNLSRRFDFPVLRQKVDEALRELEQGEGVLVLIDAYGGTSYNTTLPLLANHHICLVTGVNLPMVLSALSNRSRMSLEELSRKVSEDAKKTISVCANPKVGLNK